MKPSLQFRLSQHLTLTPQLQQSIRLLQLSTVELNQEIERMLMENPALEREDGDEGEAAPRAPREEMPVKSDAEAPAPSGDTDWSAELASNWRSGGDDEENDRSLATPDTPTPRDHLRSQLTLTKLGERDRVLVGLLIDALDVACGAASASPPSWSSRSSAGFSISRRSISWFSSTVESCSSRIDCCSCGVSVRCWERRN